MTRTAGALRALVSLLYGVLPIALLVVGYQVFYVPAQSAYLHSRNHRFLATASEQIVRRLQGFAVSLDSAVAECSGRLLENLPECPGDAVARRDCCLRHSSLRMNASVQLTVFRSQNGNEALRLETRNGVARAWWNPGDTPSIFWEYQRTGSAMPDASLDESTLYARATLADLFGPILRRGAEFFDDLYLVTDDGEKIRYQQNGNWAHLPEVRAALHRVVTEKPDGTQPADESILAFKQVLSFERQVSTGSRMRPWYVVGVVAATRLSQQKAMMSPGWGIPILIAVVLLAATYPFVKLSHMGARERLKPADAILVVFASGLLTGLTTFVLLHYTNNWFGDRTDDHLQRFAEDLQRRFGEELTAAYGQLDTFTHALRTGALDDTPNGAAVTPVTYPYFAQLTLIGSDGNAKRAWKPRLTGEGTYNGVEWCTAPQYPATERPYFRDAQRGEMPELRAGGRVIQVAIEPVVSYTSRQFLLQLALPLSDTAERPEVVAMSTRPLSLVGPTLPAGFRFAVVKQDGQVLFHSDECRNMQENLFAEVDNGWRFRVATDTKVPDVFATRYYGWEERAHIQPLDGTDWFIVTFHDMTVPYALQWTTMITWMTMFVLYLAVFFAGALLIRLLRPAYRLPWLWPNRQRRYLPALVALLIVAALVACVVGGGDPVEALLAGALGPLLALALLYLMLQPRDARWSLGGAAAAALAMLAILVASLWNRGVGFGALALAGVLAIIACASVTRLYPECRTRTEFQFRLAYAAVLTAALVIWSALPSAVLFTDARQELERARIRSLQGAFAGAVAARKERLTAEVHRNEDQPHTTACTRLIDGLKWDVYGPMDGGPRQPAPLPPSFPRAVMAWWNGQQGGERRAARTARQAGRIRQAAYHPDADAVQEDLPPHLRAPVEPNYISERFIRWLPSYNVNAAELASWTAGTPAVYDPSDCRELHATHVSTPATPQLGDHRICSMLAVGCAAMVAFFVSLSHTRKLFLLDMVDCPPPSPSLASEPQDDERNRRLWKSLKTPEEMLALIQLAEEGFLSPNNVRVANVLARQHLVRRTPALEVLDQSFREFVLTAEPAETVATWEHEEGPSSWSRLQAPLVTLCVCVGVFLFTTQRDVFDSTVGWITALTAGLSTAAPPLFRFFAMVMRPTGLVESKGDGKGTTT